MNLKKVAVCSAIMLMTTSSFAKQSVSVGGFSISGFGISLVGSVSTTMGEGNQSKSLLYVGWGLIVVGSLIDGGDLVIAAHAQEATLSPEEIKEMKTLMVAEARIANNNPALAKNLAIAEAAESFEMQGATQDERIKRLAEVTLSIDLGDQALDEILGNEDTVNNRNIAQKIEFLFEQSK